MNAIEEENSMHQLEFSDFSEREEEVRYINKVELQLVREKSFDYNFPVRSADILYQKFKYLADRPQEEMIAVYLDAKNRISAYYQVSKGSTQSTIVVPADVLRPALLCNASSIILIHNHPSGSPDPSREDISITNRIKDACEMMGMKLLDHIVIGDSRYVSMAETGLIDRKSDIGIYQTS